MSGCLKPPSTHDSACLNGALFGRRLADRCWLIVAEWKFYDCFCRFLLSTCTTLAYCIETSRNNGPSCWHIAKRCEWDNISRAPICQPHTRWGLEVTFEGPSVACKDQWIHGQWWSMTIASRFRVLPKNSPNKNPTGLEWNGQYPRPISDSNLEWLLQW